MLLRNNSPFLGILVFCLLCACLLRGATGQQDQTKQAGQQGTQPSALPADVDPADPAVPVWMRPARAATPSKNIAATPATKVPADPQPSLVGEVTKSGTGFVMRTRVDEVRLP